jgi:spermidine synthase
LVFVTSAAVLVIEILAGRLLAPYLGVSLEVFTGIIGVILAGIALGAWLGGRAADRRDPVGLLGPLLVVGGITAMLSPLIVDAVGPSVSNDPGSIIVLATLGFFMPAAVLSAVPPVVVKIRLSSLAETGSVVGSFSATGTAGALVGTFVTGFVLIAAFPTRPIMLAVGAGLAVLGVVLWSTRNRWAGAAALVAVVVIGVGLIISDGPCDYETSYHCAVVEVDAERQSGRTLWLDRQRNSYVDVADPTHLEFRYTRLMADIISVEAPDGPLTVVSVGGGGFTMPGYLNAIRPGTDNVVLEIDRSLVDIGRDHLALGDEVTVEVGDARSTLDMIDPGATDVVIGDAFSGLSVPWHLTTEEFAHQIADRLTDSGIYTINVIDYGSAEFARSAAATLVEVFDYVSVFAPPSYLAGRNGGNFVITASNSPLDTVTTSSVINARGGFELGIEGPELEAFIDGAQILRDDFAPVDQMLSSR